MKTKIILTVMLLVAFNGFSQTLNVHKTDGTITSIMLSEIEKITFTVSGETTFTDQRDGKIYRTITIGLQIWMAENLAYLPSVSPSEIGSGTEKHYYVYGYQGTSVSVAKDSANYTTYGVIYNYEAANASCPAGWHLPSDNEWTALRDALGTDSGIKAKSTSGWFNQKNGDNSSGFDGRPAGCRFKAGTFTNLGSYAYYWSSTGSSANVAWNTYLSYNSDNFVKDNRERENGFSVRCIHD